jgi:hypothetical protein
LLKVRLYRLLVASGALGLVLGNGCTSTADLLALVLGFLHGLAGSFLLLGNSLADHSVFRFELSHGVLVIVNQAESSRFAATELGAETEQNSQLGVGLVHASHNFLKLLLRDIRSARVDDIHDHLIGVKRGFRCEKIVFNKWFVVHNVLSRMPFFYRQGNAKAHRCYHAINGSDILPALDAPSSRRRADEM